METPNAPTLADEILQFYNLGREQSRLTEGTAVLERDRTLDVLGRFLPPPPATIYDVGGAAGVYAFPLARAGYQVHLVDAVPLHIEQANQAARDCQGFSLTDALVADARALPMRDESADVVLLLGPLYHLTLVDDRLKALAEAKRVLKPGGMIFAAAISRFASLLDGLSRGLIQDPKFMSLLEEDLRTGLHYNESRNPDYFTTAFFHRPEDLSRELIQAGFATESMLAVEGPAWCLPGLEMALRNPELRERVMGLLQTVEADESLLGASAHFIAVGRRQR